MPQHAIPHSSIINAALHDFGVPGLAVAVVQRDDIVFAQGYGMCTLGNEAPVDQHSLFAIGSISKSFTATALALLVDEGKLTWDTRVLDVLPTFQMYDPYVTREIRLRDLLTHRSGLPPISGGTVWYGSSHDRAAVLQRVRHLQPASSFRSQFAYQNITYLAAGEIIPAVTGQSWDTFVRERIFTPLGMQRSTTSMHELEHADNVATPHATVGGQVQPVHHRNYDNVGPAASIYASVIDMAQYLRLHLAGGTYNGQRLFSQAAAQAITTPQTVVPVEPWPAPLAALKPTFLTYGLGWFVRDYRGCKLVFHAGGVDGMVALAAMLPAQQLGVVVLTNQEAALAAALTYMVLDGYLDAPPNDWYAAYGQLRTEREAQRTTQEQQTEAARVGGTKPSLALEQYSGTYHDALYGDAFVTVESDQLVLRFSHTPSFTGDLEHWHYDTFRIRWHDPLVPPGFVTFPLTVHGKTHELKLDQPKLLDIDFSELNFARA